MCLIKSSRIIRKYLSAFLLSLCAVSVAAMASDDTVQIKQVPYIDANGHAHTLTLYGGAGVDFSRAMICDKSDDCTLFGYTNKSFDDTTDFLVIHQASKDGSSWAETFGGTNRDILFGAIQTRDGGYFVSGESESMFFTGLKIFSPHHDPRPFYIKLDSSGKLQWAGNIEIGNNVEGLQIFRALQTTDGGYVLITSYWEGYPESGGDSITDEWSGSSPQNDKGNKYPYPVILKLSADGKPEWIRRYIFSDTGGWGTDGMVMPSGDILVICSVNRKKHEALLLMKLSPDGKPLSATEYEIPGAQGSNALAQLPDGGYMVVGHVIQQDEPHYAFAAHFSPDLKFLSGTIYTVPEGIRPLGMTVGQDGKLCVLGRTENVKDNKAEGIAWLLDEKSWDLDELWLTGKGNTELEDAAPTLNGGFDIVGDASAFGSTYFDLVRTVWVPSATDTNINKRLKEEPYQPKVSDVTVITQNGKIDPIRNIPVGDINVKALQLPDLNSKN